MFYKSLKIELVADLLKKKKNIILQNYEFLTNSQPNDCEFL